MFTFFLFMDCDAQCIDCSYHYYRLLAFCCILLSSSLFSDIALNIATTNEPKGRGFISYLINAVSRWCFFLKTLRPNFDLDDTVLDHAHRVFYAYVFLNVEKSSLEL